MLLRRFPCTVHMMHAPAPRPWCVKPVKWTGPTRHPQCDRRTATARCAHARGVGRQGSPTARYVQILLCARSRRRAPIRLPRSALHSGRSFRSRRRGYQQHHRRGRPHWPDAADRKTPFLWLTPLKVVSGFFAPPFAAMTALRVTLAQGSLQVA